MGISVWIAVGITLEGEGVLVEDAALRSRFAYPGGGAMTALPSFVFFLVLSISIVCFLRTMDATFVSVFSWASFAVQSPFFDTKSFDRWSLKREGGVSLSSFSLLSADPCADQPSP